MCPLWAYKVEKVRYGTMSNDNADIMFDDVEDLQNEERLAAAAQNVATSTQQKPPSATVAAPPTTKLKSKEEVTMEKYDQEKAKLFEIYDQLFALSLKDGGEVIRNFGLSQLVLIVGNSIDRINGLVLLRSLKAKTNSLIKEESKDQEILLAKKSTSESVVSSLYEVWGIMEDGSIGLTSSYDPRVVHCIISLKSGYDFPPED